MNRAVIKLPKRGDTYQFSLIIRLVILCNLRDDDRFTMVMDTSVWLEENEWERRRLASCFFDYLNKVSIHQM